MERLQSLAGEANKPARIGVLREAWQADKSQQKTGILLLTELSDCPNELELRLHVARSLAPSDDLTEYDCFLVSGALEAGGSKAELTEFLTKAARLHPNSASLHHNLGIALHAEKRLAESLAALRRAIELKPYSDLSLTMAGSVLKEMGRVSEALEFHGTAVRINPNSWLALYNLGNALYAQDELNGALKAFKQALALSPDSVDILNNLCTTLLRADLYREAIPFLINLTKKRGDTESDLARLAYALREANRPGEAMELAEILVRRAPNSHAYRVLLGACLARIGRSRDAVKQYQKAIALNPSDLTAYKTLIYTANYLPYEDPRQLFEFYRKYSELIEQPSLSKRYPAPERRAFPRKLRVGYVSGDFCHHPVGTFIKPVLENHDPAAFDVYCYYNYERNDRVNKELRALRVQWRDVCPLSDEALCEQIRSDKIDILVDLSGHTARNRLTAFALKPAPVQVTMIGCMQTTGLRTMDYRITDSFLDPAGTSEDLHTESLIRMETGAVCFLAHPLAPDFAPLPCLLGRPFTFGSYNNLAKITPEVMDLWGKILCTHPESRMQIVADDEQFFLLEMEKRGVPRRRFDVLRRMPEVEYLDSHKNVDLILDTFPFNGLTITMNALWMGVPCVTLCGNTSASRAGTSLLGRLGLHAFITATPEEYAAAASHFCNHPQELSQVRSSLREKMRPVWADGAAHTRELEAHFRQMWKNYSGETPSAPEAERIAPLPRGQATNVPAVRLHQGTSGEAASPAEPSGSESASDQNDDGGTPINLRASLEEIAEAIDPGPLLATLLEQLRTQPSLLGQFTELTTALKRETTDWKIAAISAELLHSLEQPQDVESLRSVAKKGARSAKDWSWLGRSFLRCENKEEATEAFEQACSMDDVQADALVGLSTLLAQSGAAERAEQLVRKAIGLSPSVWEAHHNLAHILYNAGKFREALDVAEPAIRFSTDPNLLLNLSVYQKQCSELVPALQTLEKVIQQLPEEAGAYLNLGNCFLFLGMAKEAIAAYKKCLKLDPNTPHFMSNFLHSLNYVPDLDHKEFFELHREYSEKFEKPLLPHKPFEISKDPKRRLRIGYVSPDLRGHSVAFFIEPLFKHHDRSQFEVVGILSHTWKDAKTEELRSLCDGWIEAGGVSDEELAEKLRSEKFDILVDLVCHSQGARMLTFARKPAPVQVTMIGMQQTTGLDSMDYRITDAYMDPPGMSESYHSEELIRLPRAFVFHPPQDDIPIAPLPALQNGYITFGSFNNFAKAHPGVIHAWAQVLQRIPNSRMAVILPEGTNFLEAMAAEGIDPERIIKKPRLPHTQYLKFHNEIDFALDCFPFGGLTVSAIAAWMGVPTLTIAGNTPSARAGASLQNSLGLDEFIAADPTDFVERAVSLAADLPHLASVRASMRERSNRQLTNPSAYMQDYERALRTAWERWCATA